jgi:hypothetical protein
MTVLIPLHSRQGACLRAARAYSNFGRQRGAALRKIRIEAEIFRPRPASIAAELQRRSAARYFAEASTAGGVQCV